MLTRGNYRTIIFLSLVVASLWLVTKTEFLDAIFLFIFLGIVPGTEYTLPAWLLMGIAIIASVAAVLWLRAQPLFIGSLEEQEKTARQLARKRVGRKTAQPKPSKAKVKRLKSV